MSLYGAPPTQPSVVTLTKAEALVRAADLLEREATGIDLVAIVLEAIGKPGAKPLSPAERKMVDQARAGLVDPKLQMAALRGAAKAIRELALEDRLVAARVAAEVRA